MTTPHIPVLRDEVVRWLITRRDGVYIDGTIGGGGHSRALLGQLSPQATLIGIDADSDNLDIAEDRLGEFPQNIILAEANFGQFQAILQQEGVARIDGLLLDLGLSTYQLDRPDRGFSYMEEGPLHMQFSKTGKYTAAEFINTASEEEIKTVIRTYGEEKNARAIARAVIQRRPLRTTTDLREAISSVTAEPYLYKTLSRVFQAIRIEVNRELDILKQTLFSAIPILNAGGRLVVIAYHSLEDRIVKNVFKDAESDCVCPPDLPQCVCDKEQTLQILTRHVVRPSKDEIRRNPRARSARLRAGERV